MSGFPDLSDTRRGQVRPVRAGPQAARAGAAAAAPGAALLSIHTQINTPPPSGPVKNSATDDYFRVSPCITPS